MQQYHRPYDKKVGAGTGGRKRKFMDKRIASLGDVFSATKVAAKDVKVKKRKRGGHVGIRLKKASMVNVVAKDKMKTVKIMRVLESPNPEYVRMNVITRGAVVETEMGKVRVTNRVGQDGIVNGVLIQ